MTYFPAFYNLEKKRIPVFGGNKLALKRVKKLMEFKAEVFVVSPEICDEIKNIKGIEIFEREFLEGDLDGEIPFAVICRDEEMTGKIYSCCKKRNIAVNAVDMPRYSDIIFPSVYCGENFCVGVSSGGLSPTATMVIRDEIKKSLPDNIDMIIAHMVQVRHRIKEQLPAHKREEALREIFIRAFEKNRPLSEKEIDEISDTI